MCLCVCLRLKYKYVARLYAIFIHSPLAVLPPNHMATPPTTVSASLALSLSLSLACCCYLFQSVSLFFRLCRVVCFQCVCVMQLTCAYFLFRSICHASSQFSDLVVAHTHTQRERYTHIHSTHTHSQTEGNKRRFVVCAARFHFILFLIQFLLRLMCWVWRIW